MVLWYSLLLACDPSSCNLTLASECNTTLPSVEFILIYVHYLHIPSSFAFDNIYFLLIGSSIAMMNKLGSWNMLLDYGVKSVSDYLYHYELATLKCLVAEYDQNNASRYHSWMGFLEIVFLNPNLTRTMHPGIIRGWDFSKLSS
jgi:hypothetical protein